ncbi:unnamed protein product, partial [Meganyctiphanes norvegica]
MSDIEDEMIGGSDEETQEGEELTAGEVLKRLEEIWISAGLPLLRFKLAKTTPCLLDATAAVNHALPKSFKKDVKFSIKCLKIDRIRYVLSSYLRSRLEKIEKYTHYLLEKAGQVTDEDLATLSPEELKYAKEYASQLESHFNTLVLQHMSENIAEFDPSRMSVKPNLESYIFFRTKVTTNGVLIEDDTEEGRDEEVDLEEGSQHLMRYKSVNRLLQEGAITLT